MRARVRLVRPRDRLLRELTDGSARGRICISCKKVTLSGVFAGQRVGIKQADEKVGPASFMTCELGHLDEHACRLQPINDPFAPNVLLMPRA